MPAKSLPGVRGSVVWENLPSTLATSDGLMAEARTRIRLWKGGSSGTGTVESFRTWLGGPVEEKRMACWGGAGAVRRWGIIKFCFVQKASSE